jgi:N-acetylneuraminic acid mutarotase
MAISIAADVIVRPMGNVRIFSNETRRGRRSSLLGGAALPVLLVMMAALPVLAAGESGTWRAAGSLLQQRDNGQTATLLPDGTVLVAGGQDSGGTITAETEIFHPADSTWAKGPPMGVARLGHTAVRLDDGRVLVIGGLSAFGTPVNAPMPTAEIYDPAAQAWSRTGAMPTAAIQPAAVVLSDSRVLAVGGSPDGTVGTAAVQVFDPRNNLWTALRPMSTPRRGPAALLLHTGKVLVAGGAATDSDGSLATAEIYDPAANSWTTGPPMSTTHAHSLYTLLPDGRAMVSGGVDFQGGNAIAVTATDLYDPGTNTWTTAAPLRAGRAVGSGALLANGLYLAVGGYRVRNGVSAQATAEIFDPSSGTWTSLPPMSTTRVGGSVVALSGNRALVVAGTRLPDTELFNLGAPIATRGLGSVAAGGVTISTFNLALLATTALLMLAVVAQVLWRRRDSS